MAKKLTREESAKIANDICLGVGPTMDDLLDNVDPAKKPRDLSKNSVQKLRNYNVIIQRVVRWNHRETYLKLLKSFLLKQIDGETFCFEFFTLRGEINSKTNEICNNIEENLDSILDFSYVSKSKNFDSAIEDLFFDVDQFDPDIEDSVWNDIVYSESKLRAVIKEEYLPILQKSCNLDDSFFESKINLDELVKRSYKIVFSVALVTGIFLLVNFVNTMLI